MDDTISRQAAINKVKERLIETALNNVGIMQLVDEVLVDVAEERLENWFDEIPASQPSLLDALEIIDQFLHSCRDSLTCEIVAPNGMKLHTDWGYFSEGIDELRRYAERGDA